MTSQIAKPRWWRLQFSLRWLLIATAAVGVGLTAYRWPWTVTQQLTNGRSSPLFVITTLRRDWNGKPQNHGVQLDMQLADRVGYETLYADGARVRQRFYLNGKLTGESNFINGKTRVTNPDKLPNAEIRGVWQEVLERGDEQVTYRSEWRNAERHGRSTWTSSTGRELQSAEFESGILKRWNGKPVTEALEEWAAKHLESPGERRALRRLIQEEDDYSHIPMTFRCCFWLHEDRLQIGYCSRGSRNLKPLPWKPTFVGRPLGDVLLEGALAESTTLGYRYGIPCFVPISAAELNWKDPTGTDAIRFQPLSPADLDWMKGVVTDYELNDRPALQLKALCEDTEIALDTTAVDRLDAGPYTGPDINTYPDYRRPLGHVFALVLQRAGYRVEQRGETLVVLLGKK